MSSACGIGSIDSIRYPVRSVRSVRVIKPPLLTLPPRTAFAEVACDLGDCDCAIRSCLPALKQ
eukprot:15470415-Alexandrium_andersonii.AAC.1